MTVNLDLINEFKDKHLDQRKSMQLRKARRYNSKVNQISFQKRYLIWRICSDARKIEGKFSTNWEGNFHVRYVMAGEAYYLDFFVRKICIEEWNVTHLKFDYK